jgi:hypothetical protein
VFVIGYILFAINYITYRNDRLYAEVPPTVENVSISPSSREAIRHIKYVGTLDDFMMDVGELEGKGNYQIVNTRGYLGLYQFHESTLRTIGIKTSKSKFLHNPELQDSAMVVLLHHNSTILHRVIHRWAGHWYKGVYLTKSGLLAGAHLVGPGGVLSWLYPTKYHYRTSDGNGVHVSYYVKKFAGYDLRGV